MFETVDNQDEFQQKYHPLAFFWGILQKGEHQLASILSVVGAILEGEQSHELGTSLITHSCSNYLVLTGSILQAMRPNAPFPY